MVSPSSHRPARDVYFGAMEDAHPRSRARDVFGLYLREAGRHPPLRASEEKRLARTLRQSRAEIHSSSRAAHRPPALRHRRSRTRNPGRGRRGPSSHARARASDRERCTGTAGPRGSAARARRATRGIAPHSLALKGSIPSLSLDPGLQVFRGKIRSLASSRGFGPKSLRAKPLPLDPGRSPVPKRSSWD